MDFIPLSLSVGFLEDQQFQNKNRNSSDDNKSTDVTAFKRRVPPSLPSDDVGCRHGHKTVACIPWEITKRIPRIIRLHNEIEHFFTAMSPTQAEQDARLSVLDRIKSVVSSLWSGAKVEVFGSFKTGLYLPSSDLDLVIFGRWQTRPLYTLSEALITANVTTREATRVIDKATVPIIKLADTETNIKVDISFNMTNGQLAAQLIQGYLEEYPAARYLILLLKQFLNQRDLNDVFTGGLGSYSLILLVVSFLQLHSRDEGRRNPSVSSSAGSSPPPTSNYGVLLLEFFELYGLHFNYCWTGISVRDNGTYVAKDDDKKCGQMALYIEDPSCPGNDVAGGSYNIQQVQRAFAHAYHMLCHALTVDDATDGEHGATRDLCDDSVLSCIVQMPHQKCTTKPRMISQSETPRCVKTESFLKRETHHRSQSTPRHHRTQSTPRQLKRLRAKIRNSNEKKNEHKSEHNEQKKSHRKRARDRKKQKAHEIV